MLFQVPENIEFIFQVILPICYNLQFLLIEMKGIFKHKRIYHINICIELISDLHPFFSRKQHEMLRVGNIL